MVLVYMATNERLGEGRHLHEFPGLPRFGPWPADRGIGMFGVEAISPAPEGELNFQAHMACGSAAPTSNASLTWTSSSVGSLPVHRLPTQNPWWHSEPDPSRCSFE